MKEIVLWGVIAILLVEYIFLIRFFKKKVSNQKSLTKLIDSMKLESEKLELKIEQKI